MPGLDCSPNGPVWTNFSNFRLFFNRQVLGYFGLVFEYHLGWKLKENLATLNLTLLTGGRAGRRQQSELVQLNKY